MSNFKQIGGPRGVPQCDPRIVELRQALLAAMPKTPREARAMFERGEIDAIVTIRSGALAGNQYMVRRVNGERMATHEVVDRSDIRAQHATILMGNDKVAVPLLAPVPLAVLQAGVLADDLMH